MRKWPVVQIGDLASFYGMTKTLSVISEFSCPLNVVSAFLIAQLGKNFCRSKEEDQITGAELLSSAFERITIAQHEIGGQVVFLECEDGNRKLKSFYEKNAFVACGKRTDEVDGITYLQMFRFLKRTEEAAR